MTVRRARIAAGALALVAGGCSFYRRLPLDEAKLLVELRASAAAPVVDAAGTATGAAPDRSDGLSADEAVAMALRLNPALNAFRREAGVAEGEVSTASALANPEVGVEWLHLQEYYTRVMGWDVDLQWTPPQPFEWAAKRGRALARLDEARHEIAEREIALASAVREAHAELVFVTAEIGLAGRSLEARRKIAAYVEKRLARGAGTRFEKDLAGLALARAEADAERLRSGTVRAGRRLVDLIGARGEPPLLLQTATPRPSAEADALDPTALEDRALRARPALLAAKDRYETSEQALRLEHARSWPWIKFTSLPGYGNNWKNYVTNWDVGLRVTLPLFDWNGGRIDSAFAARDRERFAYQATLARTRSEIAESVAEVRASSRALRAYRERVLPALEEHEKLLQVAFRAGQLDVVALLSAEEVAQRSRREYLRAEADASAAWSRLDRVVGEPASRDAAKETK